MGTDSIKAFSTLDEASAYARRLLPIGVPIISRSETGMFQVDGIVVPHTLEPGASGTKEHISPAAELAGMEALRTVIASLKSSGPERPDTAKVLQAAALLSGLVAKALGNVGGQQAR
jgi:hypothetical protein